LEVVYKVLKLHSHHDSILTAAQKQELDKTLAEHKSGKLKYFSIKQARAAVFGKSKK